MKKLLSAILTLILIFGLFSICAMPVSAAEAGTLTSNAIQLSPGVWRTKYWTHKNYKLNCYNRIEVPSRGYITFTASKPFDDEGELCSYDLVLYDATGNVIWAADTSAQKDSFNDYYSYKIGLNKGTYYMNIDPSFYVYSNSAPIETQHKYTFTKSNYWEIESNNDLSKATEITLGKMYYGVYADESYDTSYRDYFKFYLTKGKTYNLYMYNYNELEAGTLIEDLLDPFGNEVGIFDEDIKDVGNAKCWTFTTQYNGWYALRFDNDGNDAGTEYQIKVEQQKISSSTCTAKLSTTKYTYNGSKKTPKVVVKNASGKTLNENVDYTVTYPSSRKNVGKYKVVIKFKGSYTGTKNLYFTINPAKTSVKKLSSGKKSLTVAITKKSTQTTGYEVQYSTSKKFKSAKVKKIKSYKTTSLTIKSLKAKKTYYVRVRTFKKVDGKTYYSSWSSAKSKKTK